MTTLLLAIGALLLLTAAGYVHHRLPRQIRGRANTLLTRAVLLRVGGGIGTYCARYALTRPDAVLAFLNGLGLVHVPAAAILFLKRMRGEGRT